MATVTQGSSESFTLDAFGYLTITQCGSGTLAGVSHAPNIKSDVSYTKLAPVQYGPFGVPMDMTLTATDRDITYSTTAGYGGAITTNDDGVDVIIGADGTEYPLPTITGPIKEGTIDGEVQSIIEIDSGSDTADHDQILLVANCTLSGNPDAPDNALAIARFADYAADTEVFKSGIDGGTAGEAFLFVFAEPVTQLHVGVVGNTAVGSTNTADATNMVNMAFAEAEGVIALEVRMLSARLGTSGYRYRQIAIAAYGSAA